MFICTSFFISTAFIGNVILINISVIVLLNYIYIFFQEYIFPDARDRQFLLRFHQLAKKEKLDIEKYNKLRSDIVEAEHDLQRLRDPLQMHLPIREMKKD